MLVSFPRHAGSDPSSEKYTVMVMPVPCASEIYGGTESLSVYLRDKKPGALKKPYIIMGLSLIFAGRRLGGEDVSSYWTESYLTFRFFLTAACLLDELRKI